MDDINKSENIVYESYNKFGEEQVRQSLADLQRYVEGKQSVDIKATVNQQWWRLRHWDTIAWETNEGLKSGVTVGSAWAINSLLNKHADIMDSFPKPNVLPREADDEGEAKILTDIIPSILEQNDYEQIYRQMAWDVCIDGAAITGVFWDSSKYDGLGDIALSNIDVHNLFWQPGVQDIQDSDKVYYVALEDLDLVRATYPKVADKIGPQDTGIITKYVHDDNIDTSHMVEVINLYYKKTVTEPVYMHGIDEMGQMTEVKIHEVPKTILHLAIIVGDQLVFCSENEKGYEEGFYSHGQYPFVIRRLFPIKDSPWGFGYLDIMKNSQKDIDKIDQAIIKNTLLKTKPRYWARKNANIDMNDFADWNKEIVEVASGELDQAVKQIVIDTVPNAAFTHLANKVDELKETSGNRDFSQGATAQGVTAASAIAALQEAGSKLSRDINKELYRGAREEYYLIVELIRQFYDEERSFRIDDTFGGFTFESYSNINLKPQEVKLPDGSVRHKKAMFDILVTAEKQSPFSRAAQNETAKELYSLGLFAPENSIPALVCLDMMDFEGKDKIIQQIQQNSIMLQQYQSAMMLISQLSMADPRIAQMAMQSGLVSPEQMAQMDTEQQMAAQAQPRPSGGATPEERAASNTRMGDNSQAAKARLRAAKAAQPR